MAMEDMEQDPEKINDWERQIEQTIFKQGQEYAARNQRSKAENKGRAESRAKIKELGMDANAYATAVRLIKDKTASERDAWLRDLKLTLKVLGSKQRELFPEEALKAEQRAKRKAEEAASKPRTQAELDAASDANPKSDPKAGGAQIDLEDVIAAASDNPVGTFNDGAGKPTLEEREAAEGEAVLAGKSDAWRGGHNAHSAGGQRSDNPYTEGTAEARDWYVGFEAATQAAFDAAQPAESAPANVTKLPAPKKKQSQSEKAAAKKAAAGLH